MDIHQITAKAAEDVRQERLRQITGEGWNAAHDDAHTDQSLASAASCYANPNHPFNNPPLNWPWERQWWKPKTRREDLVRAGALILAEIERIDRAAQS